MEAEGRTFLHRDCARQIIDRPARRAEEQDFSSSRKLRDELVGLTQPDASRTGLNSSKIHHHILPGLYAGNIGLRWRFATGNGRSVARRHQLVGRLNAGERMRAARRCKRPSLPSSSSEKCLKIRTSVTSQPTAESGMDDLQPQRHSTRRQENRAANDVRSFC